jgi:hypothetical protein
MSSNSIRVSERLFEQAKAAGEVWSRSAAQQVEHWARIGQQVESLGLTVRDVLELLERRAGPSEASLWAYKRAWQQEDLQRLEEGEPAEPVSLFSGGLARKARLPGSPF